MPSPTEVRSIADALRCEHAAAKGDRSIAEVLSGFATADVAALEAVGDDA